MHTSNGTSNGTNGTEPTFNALPTDDSKVDALMALLVGAVHDGADEAREALSDSEAEKLAAAKKVRSTARKLAWRAAGLDPSYTGTTKEAREALRSFLARVLAKRA